MKYHYYTIGLSAGILGALYFFHYTLPEIVIKKAVEEVEKVVKEAGDLFKGIKVKP
jgi:hypothetical protein